MKISICVAPVLLVTVAAPAVVANHSTQREPPNVLLIVSEDHGPHLGCYGERNIETPNLDQLASEGVRFTRAFVTTASCSESRSSILTGLYPHQNGQFGVAERKYTMWRHYPTICSLLKEQGYRTGILGKLHLNPVAAFPFDLSWRPPRDTERDVRRLAEMAGHFMGESDQPFFLMVNYPDAHVPFVRQYKGLPQQPLKPDQVQLPSFIGVDTPNLRAHVADYYNCLARLDAGVGLLLEELENHGLVDRTLVIFLSDHGPQFLRGKLTCYEPGLRVPLIIRWPNEVEPGLVREEMVSTIDLLPTIMEAVGATPPAGLSGRSMLGLARGQNMKWREWIHAEFHAHYPPLYFPQRTISDGRYKMIVNLLQDRPNPKAACYVSPRSQWACLRIGDIEAAQPKLQRAYATWEDAPPVELYDLHSDPHELNNLADKPEFASLQQRLDEQLTKWRRLTNDPLTDPQLLAKLTQENDTLREDYKTDVTFHWRYPKYLGPVHHDEKRGTTP